MRHKLFRIFASLDDFYDIIQIVNKTNTILTRLYQHPQPQLPCEHDPKLHGKQIEVKLPK